ncbi:MAG: hypothetical protein FJ390_03290 [Verrucomicrobia bacterium]|nr:hypothetical protein [Verrucomicrobiota bacterium]
MALILTFIAIAVLFFLRKNFVSENREPSVSPADFVDSKRHALDLLGALVNRGFRVRDEVWEISLRPRKMELLQLTLFAGNQYWFAVAASAPAQRLKLALYDDEGRPVALDLWKDDHAISGARIAGGLVITCSGNYYVGVELLEEADGKTVPASLVYAYQ